MPEASMKIIGAEELYRKLQDLEKKASLKVIKKGLKAGADLVLESVRSKCPVDTGRLKRSLESKTGKTKKGYASMIVQPSSKKEPGLVSNTKKDNKRYYYPAVLEYGSSRQAAKPFMRPAFDATKRIAVQRAIEVMKSELESEAMR